MPELALPSSWRRRLIITACCLASLFVLYALAGFFLAPYLITRYAPQYAAKQLHLRLTPGQVRINPLLLTFAVEGLDLRSEKNEPLFSLKRLFVDFEAESLFSQAWTFADFVVESPIIHLVIEEDGRLNLAIIAERLPRATKPPEAEKKLPGLLLKHLKLAGGAVHLSDNSGLGPVKTSFAPVAIELHHISTLAGQRGAYTISAALPDGAAIGWQGGMTLQPLKATGAIEIKGLKAATAWKFFQDDLNLAEPTGTASLTAGYDFSLHQGKPALLVNRVNLRLSGLSLAEKGVAQPIMSLDDFNLSGGQLDFFAHQMTFPSLALTGGRVAALVNETGSGNWQRLLKEKPESDQPPWQIKLESCNIADLGFSFHDASRPAPISLEAKLNLALTGASLDLGRKEANLARLAINGKELTLVQAALSNDPAGKKKEAAESEPKNSAAPNPWKLALKLLTISGFNLGLVDQQSTPPLAYDLTDLQAELKDFANTSEKPLAFALKSKIRQGGSASLKGTVAQAGGKIGAVEARISLSQLNLKPLESLLTKQAALTLVSGDLSADVNLRYVPQKTKPLLTMEGEAKIGQLLLKEDDTGDRLLAFKELAASGLDFSLNPDHLAIKEIRLRQPETKIIIFKDKSLNLAKIRKTQAPPEREKAEKPPFPVAVERVRLEDGVVDFADFSLVLPFVARIEQCRGAVVGISSKPDSRASLKLEGRVGKFGQAKAEGSLAPANPKKFTDLKVVFRNVDLPHLSPYSATFAGRLISKGRLDLDLEYKIKESELLGDNSVILHDFTLGERVESPGAMQLPLDLAIALLTDREGKIDLALPVRGNVDHPEFSYGHLVRQAIVNLLGKIVTAPFRALAALFGGNAENLEMILFEPGQAELAPPEQEKLNKVATALEKRNQLQLTVHGGFAPDLDGAALKVTQLRLELAQRLGLKLEPGEDPGPMAFDQAKTQRALEGLAGNRLAAFAADYQKSTGNKGKRVNPALALLGRASEDHDFYRALFTYLAENITLPENKLPELAGQRSAAIVKELTQRAGVSPERVSVGPASQQEGQNKAVPARLELGVR